MIKLLYFKMLYLPDRKSKPRSFTNYNKNVMSSIIRTFHGHDTRTQTHNIISTNTI